MSKSNKPGLDYSVFSKAMDLAHYDMGLDAKLIGIANEYGTILAENNKQIFTGELKIGSNTLKYPKNLSERLMAQKFALNAKDKIAVRYADLFSKEKIFRAMRVYTP